MIYDLIVIGAGPAGYSAGLYASRFKINNLIIGEMPGGIATEAHKVCNYPGFTDISGVELMNKFREQAIHAGSKGVIDRVVLVKEDTLEEGGDMQNVFKVSTLRSGDFYSKYLLLCTGSKRRKLGLPREDEFRGKGVSYCSTCDAMFFKEKIVGVVGGANAAVVSAIHLADVARKVYVIYRGQELRAEPVWIESLKHNEKIEVIYGANVVDLHGDKKLSGVKLDKDDMVINLDGLFIEIGFDPDLSLTDQLKVQTDANGYIIVNADQSTNIPMVYAAGDTTTASNGLRQIVTAASEGAIAVQGIFYDMHKS